MKPSGIGHATAHAFLALCLCLPLSPVRAVEEKTAVQRERPIYNRKDGSASPAGKDPSLCRSAKSVIREARRASGHMLRLADGAAMLTYGNRNLENGARDQFVGCKGIDHALPSQRRQAALSPA